MLIDTPPSGCMAFRGLSTPRIRRALGASRPKRNEAPTVTCGASWRSSDGLPPSGMERASAPQRRIVGSPSIEDSGEAEREIAGEPNR
jgi:hypothetical protein